jgi:integrase
VALDINHFQQREEHWAIVDLVGKGGHVRTVPVPEWIKTAVDGWARGAGISEGKLFRSIRKNGTLWGSGVTQNVVWYVVKSCAKRAGIDRLAPHDLRRYAECQIMPNRCRDLQFGAQFRRLRTKATRHNP